MSCIFTLVNSEIEESKNKNLISNWKKGLILNLILVSIMLLLRPLFINWDFYLSYALWETTTMIIAFGIPIYLVLKNEDWNKEDIGLQWSTPGLFYGIIFYTVFSMVFIYIRFSFDAYVALPVFYLILRAFSFLIIMFLVDLWFHGFLFLGIHRYHGIKNALLAQNVYWFIFHLYEMSILIPKMGIFLSCLFIVLSGIIGDLIAYKTKSIYGLAIGHFILNLLIITFALTR